MSLVALYLAAIVAANLAIATYGPVAAIPVAFLLVGLDLTTRDALHDRWAGRGLLPRMTGLIALGGALSWALNRDAGQIALASTVAFVAAAGADGLVYHLLRARRWAHRVAWSNLAGAAVDSLLFPTIAFGVLLPGIVVGQLVAKVAGGFVWSLVLAAIAYRRESGEEGAPMAARDFALYYRLR